MFPPRCCACTSRARRSPRRCHDCRRPTAARWPTRSSISPTHFQRALAPQGDRVLALTAPPLEPELQKESPLRASVARSGLRALPPPGLHRPEAVLARGTRRTDPILDTSLELARAAGAREVVIGMAHRGRLNSSPTRSVCPTSRSCASSRASGRSRWSPPTPRAAPATSSTTSAPRASARPRPARSG